MSVGAARTSARATNRYDGPLSSQAELPTAFGTGGVSSLPHLPYFGWHTGVSPGGQYRHDENGFLIALAASPSRRIFADARVKGIVIEHRDSPAYKGQSFGEAGAYEWIRGHAYGELDPKDPLNAIVTDLQFAPKNAQGFVEYSVTFTLTKPVDLSKASGVLLYDKPTVGYLSWWIFD